MRASTVLCASRWVAAACGTCVSICAWSASPFSNQLTGDWGGSRTALAERGVTLDFESAHYYQGLLSGSGDNDFEYAGRLDALLNFDTAKLGLWKGGLLRTHTEYRYGDPSPNLGGALLATNSGLILPTGKHEEIVVTSIHLAQQIGDRINVLVGRINALDLIAGDPFFGGGGRSRLPQFGILGAAQRHHAGSHYGCCRHRTSEADDMDVHGVRSRRSHERLLA